MKEEKNKYHIIQRIGKNIHLFNEYAGRKYDFIAKIILKSPDYIENSQHEWEFKSLAQLAIEDFCRNSSWWLYDVMNDEIDIVAIIHRAEEDFATHLNYHLYSIDEGLPLYSMDSKGAYKKCNQNEFDLKFLNKFIKQGLPDHYSSIPDWADKFFINFTDKEAYALFYYDLSSTPRYSEQLEVRKKALALYLSGYFDDSLDERKQEDTVAPRERSTFLIILAALAKEAGINIERHEAAGVTIQKLTEQLGAPISNQTIANKLKEIPGAIETRSK